MTMSTDLTLATSYDTCEETSQVIATRRLTNGQFPHLGARSREQDVAPAQTTVRFIEGEGGCSVLEVETSERSGFVQGLSRALIQESVQIVRAEVKRVTGGVVDRFTIAEPDGSPITAAKRLALQVAVLSAVDLAS